MIEYYKHASKVEAFQMARDYDLAQQIASSPADRVTKHWAKPVQDVDGVWYVQKPKHLECSIVAQCYPNSAIVQESEIEWPPGYGLE